MKNIEDKLDGFEQILAILVKKISMLESLVTDPKVPVDNLVHQKLDDIQTSITKNPSGNMMLSELVVIRKRLDAFSNALEYPKPVTLDWKPQSYLFSMGVLLCVTAASLATVKCSNEELEQGRRTVTRYEMAQQISPRLTRMIDQAFEQTTEPSVDSLRNAWELLNTNSRKLENSKRTRR